MNHSCEKFCTCIGSGGLLQNFTSRIQFVGDSRYQAKKRLPPGIFSLQVSVTLNYRAFAGVFDRLEGGYAIDISRGRALYKREVKHKKYNKRRAENPLRRLKTSDDVFRTKNGGFYNQLWENSCRIRTKNQKLHH